jgi:beta-alanine--pyruvate transaminase
MTDLSALDLDAYWMPLTPNRAFKRSPRLVVGAKDMYYTTADGKQVLDGLATLWCVNAGHCRPKIVTAIGRQAGVLDYASSYSLGHPLAFEAAHRLVALAPEGIGHAFFTNSGSEAVETALKIALAYHRLRGEATRTRFVGRERAFHGANFGGISVGGVPA